MSSPPTCVKGIYSFFCPRQAVHFSLKMVKQTRLPLLLAEALPCRLDRIQAKFTEQCKDLKPDAFLQLTVLLSQIEHIVGIHYTPGVSTSASTKPTCVVCGRSYSRISSLNSHISLAHQYLRRIIEARSCNSCDNEFDSPRQLVYHERSIHKAAYLSRADFIWPGFEQLNSREGGSDRALTRLANRC